MLKVEGLVEPECGLRGCHVHEPISHVALVAVPKHRKSHLQGGLINGFWFKEKRLKILYLKSMGRYTKS